MHQIKDTDELKDYLSYQIEDAGLQVGVDPTLSEDEYIGIKVDDYYMGLRLGGETPKAVDFIVSVDCQCECYNLYVLELKNVNSPQSYTTEEILEKFDTAIERFMKDEFKHIFLNDRYKYKDFNLYLVTTAYKKAMEYSNFEAYARVMEKVKQKDTLTQDCRLSGKLYRFRNMVRRVEREIPPNPVIKRIL